MKQILMVLFAALLCMQTAIAQHSDAVPQPAKAAFAKAYPNATKAKWEKEHALYEVSFEQQGKKMSVLYDEKGKAEETETDIAIDGLPAAAKKYAMAKGKIKEAARIIKADGSEIYEAEVGKKDLLFDSKRNFIGEGK